MNAEETKKAAEVMLAWAEGKVIEYHKLGSSSWLTMGAPKDNYDNAFWDWNEYDYHIKSEPHYRPFESAEEVMEAIKEHGDWIKWKDGSGFNLIVCVADSALWLGAANESICFREVYNNTTFADGTPFGKLEE